MTMTAAIYLRISSDPAGERAGVERQRADCEALASRHGWTVTGVYEDNDLSAYSGKVRPAFERLIADASAGAFDRVIVWASDRLYRRVADLTRITDDLATRAPIVTVMGGDVDLTTAEGILRAQVMGSVGEFESRRKGERVAARARQRAEDGLGPSAIRPFGWAWVDPCPGGPTCAHRSTCEPEAATRPRQGSRAGLRPHPVEGPALARAYRRVADGVSLRSAASLLAEECPTGTRSAAMGPSTLRGALLAARNAGLVAHRGVVVAESADGARIVPRDLWERVRVILTDPSRRTSPGRPTTTPLAKILRCSRCDGPMSASVRHSADGVRTPVYLCSRNRHLSRRRALLDGPILDLVGDVLAVLAARGTLIAARDDTTGDPIRGQIADLEARRDTLAGLVTSGALDPADYATAAARIRTELGALTAALARASGRPAVAALGADVAAAWGELRDRADSGDVDGLRAVLSELVDHIDVLPPAIGGRPQTVDVAIVWAEWVPGSPPTCPDREAGPVALSIAARRAEAGRLHADGLNVGQIADRLGVYRATIRRDLAATGVRPIPTRAVAT